MVEALETRCNEADCTFPACACWEIKRRSNPGRIPKLEKALMMARDIVEAEANTKENAEAIAMINDALKY